MPRLPTSRAADAALTEVSIEPFTHAHLDGLIALVAAEGWTQYTADVERTRRALTAPGVTTLVAIAGGHLAGASRSLGFRLTRVDLGLDGAGAE